MGISLTTSGHQSDRLDQFPFKAVLPKRIRLYGRQLDSGHPICHSWPSCGRVSAVLRKRPDLCFVCWHVDRSSFLGEYLFPTVPHGKGADVTQGGTADIIGRKFAFNTSLFVAAIFAIVAAGSPNWIVLGLFVSLAAFGAGGNLVLDTTVFLEYLPKDKQWMVTSLAAWWGLAPLFPAAFAWPLFSDSRYACDTDFPDQCTRANNMGWRYVWIGCGGLILLMSIARITVIRLKETPKFLLGEGKDEAVVANLQSIATRYNRQCDLTLEDLQACGTVTSAHRKGLGEIWFHIRGLFVTKKLALSTCLIWLSWTLIGLAYPLFYVFLPQYLASRGANTGAGSPAAVWRDYFISNTIGIFGPILAGYMATTRLGRR